MTEPVVIAAFKASLRDSVLERDVEFLKCSISAWRRIQGRRNKLRGLKTKHNTKLIDSTRGGKRKSHFVFISAESLKAAMQTAAAP